MRNAWKIAKTDFRNIGTNWVAAILVGGLVFLPSLYAWFNIYASWDPYGRTDRLPVAVVNEDRGADVRDEHIDVGKQLVESLKKNKNIDWKFTDRKDAMDEVTNGKYFAAIIVPEDFSEKLGTVVSGNPQKAEMEYYVNEKINSIAPKITEKGATSVVQKLSSEFTSTVNRVIFDMFNQIGLEIQQDLPDIEKFEQYVFMAEEQLPGVHDLLQSAYGDAENADAMISKAQNAMPEAKRLTNEGLGTINRTLGYLNDAEKQLAAISPKIDKDLETASRVSKEVNDMLTKIQNTDLDTTQLDEAKKRLDDRMTEAIQSTANIGDELRKLKEMAAAAPDPSPSLPVNPNTGAGGDQAGGTDQNGESGQTERPVAPDVKLPEVKPDTTLPERRKRIDEAIESTDRLQGLLQEAQTNARAVDEAATGYADQAKGWLSDIQKIAQNVSVSIDSYSKEYHDTIKPTIDKEIAGAKKTLTEAKTMLTGIQDTIPQAEKILNSTAGDLAKGETVIKDVLNQYPYVYTKVSELADRIREIQGETDINDIIDLLVNNPEAERDFFQQPIVLHENKLFPIKNYGTGMTPFYTVLSIWVGCLLLISLLSTDVHREETFHPRTVYFGRLITFSAIGLLQALVVTLGDLFVLGVEVAEPAGFVLSGLFISLVFMSIVYTLVSVFGDVGKAMAIVMLVLQIAGSGGTYPVVLLPDFFRGLSPFLPFTYAIDLMREMTGGAVQARVMRDVPILLGIAVAFILFGSFFKARLTNSMNKLMKKSRESGLFH
ncbi:YhgE/Pip domain-containing protein [Edaphobacillus lindanitolerans]|uniref:Putative membrane protein n=1 Tax=Edaphobacillus lindanitolerans TaxID=550447 RepID=A0A1U7PJ54_9BACI|nr:YhgE/Pip domain-containing protein [Edaphobacillus lindanitolerans]SIT80408.1 putative membrane protein [Edaphobacillus lindanitolerans]